MSNRQTVLALGFFDGLHIGHAALVNKAKQRAAELQADPAVLTFDVHPDTFVKKEPVELINSADDRKYIAKRYFDIEKLLYLHFNEETMHLPWQTFMENVVETYSTVHFVIGHDFCCGYRGEGKAEILREWCHRNGIGCDIIAPVLKDGIIISSSYIRELIRNGEVKKASEFLGHPHLLTDTVRTGFRIGRTMDFPTINMQFAEGVLTPKYGVYISCTRVQGKVLPSVTNIGLRPTFHGNHVTVETHLLDFSGDLYGETACVEFYEFLRPEQKFDNAEALMKQIQADVAKTKEYYLSNPTEA